MPALLPAAIFIAFTCPVPKVVNTTKFPWNRHDEKTLSYANKRCGQVYKDAPCVTWFKKWGKQDYSVVCGGRQK